MNSLGLLILNDLDDIIAALFQIRSGISLEQQEVEIHTRRDHFFSMSFAFPFIIWVLFYSLVFLQIIEISSPSTFITLITYVQFIATIVLVPIWYLLVYLKVFGACIDKIMDLEVEEDGEDGGGGNDGEKADTEKDNLETEL